MKSKKSQKDTQSTHFISVRDVRMTLLSADETEVNLNRCKHLI